MIIFISIVAILVVVFILGKINLSIIFRKEVTELFAQSKNISGKTFHAEQLQNLPEPV